MGEDFFVSSIKAQAAQMRRDQFEKSNQLTLGELIDKLERIPDENNDKRVMYDFEYAFPTHLDSWRGIYAELALGFDLLGYGSPAEQGNAKEAPLLRDLVDHLKESVGKVFTGWKGGDFTMTRHTPVWVANSGNSGNTAIVGVFDEKWQVVIRTEYIQDN